MAERLPSWFLAHGAPLHALGEQPVRRFWAGLPHRLPRPPRALLCLSAHWQAARPTLAGQVAAPRIQHDFHGFPPALYQIRWPLQGEPKTAAWLATRLRDCLEVLDEDPAHPLDHGVWVPLASAWPAPPFPVYQLAMPDHEDPHAHWTLGQRLAPLRDEGVLIVGSGGLVHNLRRLDGQAPRGQAAPWAADFMQALEAAIAAGDRASLCEPWCLPHGREAVPSLEHYLPLLVTLGAAEGEPVTPLYRDWEYGSLALHSYAAGEASADGDQHGGTKDSPTEPT